MPPFLTPRSLIVLAASSSSGEGLLRRLISKEHIRIAPPSALDETGFDSLRSRDRLTKRLQTIADDKADEVRDRLGSIGDAFGIIAATTMIAVGSDQQGWQALGRPPASHWQRETRRWFREFYAGKAHLVMTALHVRAPGGVRKRVVTTKVVFRKQIDDLLEAYIATGEPQGRIGGYVIQGLGSLFVERVEGSPSNLLGLPLRELAEMLCELDFVSYGR